MFLLGLCGFAYAQNIQIKGTVTSATDSYPIIGASVVDKADKTNGSLALVWHVSGAPYCCSDRASQYAPSQT